MNYLLDVAAQESTAGPSTTGLFVGIGLFIVLAIIVTIVIILANNKKK